MLTILIGIVAFVAIFAAASNGEWGSVAIGIVIVLLLMLASSIERREGRAEMNWEKYWERKGRR